MPQLPGSVLLMERSISRAFRLASFSWRRFLFKRMWHRGLILANNRLHLEGNGARPGKMGSRRKNGIVKILDEYICGRDTLRHATHQPHDFRSNHLPSKLGRIACEVIVSFSNVRACSLLSSMRYHFAVVLCSLLSSAMSLGNLERPLHFRAFASSSSSIPKRTPPGSDGRGSTKALSAKALLSPWIFEQEVVTTANDDPLAKQRALLENIGTTPITHMFREVTDKPTASSPLADATDSASQPPTTITQQDWSQPCLSCSYLSDRVAFKLFLRRYEKDIYGIKKEMMYDRQVVTGNGRSVPPAVEVRLLCNAKRLRVIQVAELECRQRGPSSTPSVHWKFREDLAFLFHYERAWLAYYSCHRDFYKERGVLDRLERYRGFCRDHQKRIRELWHELHLKLAGEVPLSLGRYMQE